MKCTAPLGTLVCLVTCLAWHGTALDFATAQQSTADDDFRSVLELAELGPEVLATLTLDSDCTPDGWNREEWEIAAQLLARLKQTPADQLQRWVSPQSLDSLLDDPDAHLGVLAEFSGTVISVEQRTVPEKVLARFDSPNLYLCRMAVTDSPHTVIVMSPAIPQRWKLEEFSPQAVSLRGVMLPNCDGSDVPQGVVLTDRLRWFPTEGVPRGQALLAGQGMNASLWDEVVHRAPFVSLEVSRESTAFYSALAAVSEVAPHELQQQARETVAAQAEHWQSHRASAEATVRELRASLRAAEEHQREELQQKLQAATRQVALARAVVEQAERGQSSVAPLFLQPEQHVGELVMIEGIARRAIRIIAGDSAAVEGELPAVSDYYEMEIFTSDSQNLPVVCCVNQLPEGFPTGDAIREPVRVAGVFFKSWRYRTRQIVEGPGETNRQQQLYTPIVVGDMPTWLQAAPSVPGWGGPVAGAVFLLLLLGLWFVIARTSRRNRIARPASESVDFRDLS